MNQKGGRGEKEKKEKDVDTDRRNRKGKKYSDEEVCEKGEDNEVIKERMKVKN